MTIENLLNGNNNFIHYQYNTMEEYDYWEKTKSMEEIKRWRDIKQTMASKRCLGEYNYTIEIPPMEIDKYPILRAAINDYLDEGIYGYHWFKSFAGFKGRMTKGDYKLNGYWDKFRKQLYEYNGVRDVRGYMINISPKWPDKYGLSGYSKHLERAIEKFARSGKWKEFHYVIENGKDGNHLHAHCVCIPTDPKLAKTYIMKGNHYQWFKREFDNLNNKYPVGFVGCVKGKHSIQVVQINNHEIYKDKLKYLQEETKPEDHQNKTKLMDRREIDFS